MMSNFNCSGIGIAGCLLNDRPLDEIITWSVMGPVYDGQHSQPELYDGMTAESPITLLGLWGATLAMWPSVVQPPYGISDGWLWVWTMVVGERTWHTCMVY